MIILHKSKGILVFLGLTGVVFLAATGILGQSFSDSGVLAASVQEAASTIVITETRETSVQQLPREIIVPPKQIEAIAAISLEVGKTGQKTIFEKSATKTLPIASLTKLMTALVVMERYNLAQKITINEAAMAEEGDQGELKTGQIFSVKSLLYIMLMESSNRAAFALADAMGLKQFVALMNENAKILDLSNTHFIDSTGLSEKSSSSAHDVAVLSAYLFENYPLFKEIVGTREIAIYLEDGPFHHKAVITNSLLGTDNIIGGKTGYTDLAEGCFMVLQKTGGDEYMVHVILGAKDRVAQMQKLIK